MTVRSLKHSQNRDRIYGLKGTIHKYFVQKKNQSKYKYHLTRNPIRLHIVECYGFWYIKNTCKHSMLKRNFK